MNIALIYHKDPYSPNPRGGEMSVRAIVEYLREKGHSVNLHSSTWLSMIENCDIVLTWGKPAMRTAVVCKDYKKPLVLMVRFWRNIAPLPAGNLMTREIDHAFTEEKRLIFETASAIITNTHYARQVIERWQPVSRGKVHVSYVPILGQYEPCANPAGKILVITPEIYGEQWLVNGLAELMPDEQFLVVNFDNRFFKSNLPNVEVRGYCDMDEVWPEAKILLVPVYGNDICGTRRSTIEFLRSGGVVLASDRCGMNERVNPMLLVDRDAGIDHWVNAIQRVNENREYYQDIAKQTWEKYDTPTQLQKFEQILLSCTS